MATYEPPAELLERQLESLRAQTHTDWVCVISDDASTDEAFARLERLTAGDPRFVVSRAPERAGAYANFARALAMVPAERRPRRALPTRTTAGTRTSSRRCSARSATRGWCSATCGSPRPTESVISDTYWTRRVPNHDNYASLLLGNSVTGAAALFRRDLLDEALPLPPRAGNLYHDHWLALVAASTRPDRLRRPPALRLRPAPEAVIGHAGANVGVVGGGVAAAARGPARPRRRGRLRAEWRRIYFAEYCRMALTAVALEQRLGPALGTERRAGAAPRPGARPLRRAPRAWLATRQLRRLARDDTGGSETGLLRGLAWRRALALRGGRDPLDDADLPPGIVGVDPSPATRVLR